MGGSKNLWLGLGALISIAAAGTAIYFELQPDRPAFPIPRPMVTRPQPEATPAEVAKQDEQDRVLQEALAAQRRWVQLPSFLFDLDRDATGHMWFGTFGSVSATPAEFRRSVERASQGLSRIIRGGKILIVDSAGRYWGYTINHPEELLCYDGKKWLAPYAAPLDTPAPTTRRSAVPSPAPARPPVPRRSRFVECALQDSVGNLYFVSNGFSTGSGLHKLSLDGAWTFIPFPNNAHIPRNPMLTEQLGGRITVFPSIYEWISGGATKVQQERKAGITPHPRSDLPAVYTYDGKGLATYQPADQPEKELWIRKVLALPDGSILVTCEDDDTMWLVWPQTMSAQMQADAQKWLAALDDDSAATRATAMTELLKLGPPIRGIVEQAAAVPADELSPQMQASLAALLPQLKDSVQELNDKQKVRFGGRYQLAQVTRGTRTLDGKVRLIAMECYDEQAAAELGPTMLTVDGKGKWSAMSIPANTTSWLPQAIHGAYEDMTGTLWTGDWKDHVLNADFTQTLMAPAACKMGVLQGSDRDGRVYFRDKDWMVCNRQFPVVAPEMNVTSLEGCGFSSSTNEPTVWVLNDHSYQVLADGTEKPFVRADGRSIAGIESLNGAAGLIWLVDASEANDDQPTYHFSLYDGSTWHDSPADKIGTFVRENAVQLTHLVSTESDLSQCSSSLFMVGDRGVGLWSQVSDVKVVSDGTIGHNQPINDLEYFDGTAWHDVWAIYQSEVDAAVADLKDRYDGKIPADQMIPIAATNHFIAGSVEHGRKILVYTQTDRSLAAISCENGQLVRDPVAIEEVLGRNRPTPLPSMGRRDLYWSQVKKEFKLAEWEGGQFKPIDCPGKPLLADSNDRIWFQDNERLIVKEKDQSASVEVAGYGDNSKLIQSHDGRVWLMYSVGLQEYATSWNDGKLALQARGPLLKWNAPANYFDAVADGGNHLWLKCFGQMAKIELPKP